MGSLTVTLQCPLCDDGTITATCSPEAIEDLSDDGCGHGDLGIFPTERHRVIWQAVEDYMEGRRLDAEASRYETWRDQ